MKVSFFPSPFGVTSLFMAMDRPKPDVECEGTAGASSSAAEVRSSRQEHFIYRLILLFNCDCFITDLWIQTGIMEISL